MEEGWTCTGTQLPERSMSDLVNPKSEHNLANLALLIGRTHHLEISWISRNIKKPIKVEALGSVLLEVALFPSKQKQALTTPALIQATLVIHKELRHDWPSPHARWERLLTGSIGPHVEPPLPSWRSLGIARAICGKEASSGESRGYPRKGEFQCMRPKEDPFAPKTNPNI